MKKRRAEKILKKTLGCKLNEQEVKYLGYITSSARNMQQLIGDLLEFSRANSQKRRLETVALESIQSEIEKDLGVALVESGTTLSWQFDNTTILVDRTKLRQILENLINNAIKFMTPDRTPRIAISMKDQADYWLFEVKDNGIGIAEEFHEQIFTIFRRLHTQSKYEGTGIGLALCKQLIEQHDGHIWVKSKKGTGSSFYFTIAKDLE